MDKMDKEELLNKIMENDFMLIDLRLYLNTHANDKQAIESYNKYTLQSRNLHDEFEKKYGPLSYTSQSNSDMFSWIDNPWPWEKTYLKGER